ncbi:hypothetical protein AGMMS50262_16680 [Bacteroidia bacterium]|nr:hypothetical protein AGMMS50262_16680 [Bacteroidia bacterium]
MSQMIQLLEYRDWLGDLKQQIKTSQIKAVLSVNSQMIMLYWNLGKQIAEKQEYAKWGSGFIEQLSKDLQAEFPEMKGFSKRNLEIIKRFYLFYSDNNLIAKQVVSQTPKLLNASKIEQLVPKLIFVPWGHHIKIMQKCKNPEQALFYINNPIGVSTFHYTELAEEIKAALPSVEKLQNELLNFERNFEAK